MTYPVLQRNGYFPSNIPWAEHVGQHGDHGPRATFSYSGEAHATLQIQVNWADGPTAITDLLGIHQWSFNTSSQVNTLSRTVPMRHPYFPHLYCTKIQDMVPIKYTGKGIPPGLFTGFTFEAQYDRWLITAGFEDVKYRVLDDSTLQNLYGFPLQEWQRWVEWHPKPSVFELTREASSAFKWVEGPLAGTAFASPVAQHLQRVEYHAIWRTVPYNGLFVEGTNQLNSNIRGALNTVNNATFLGNRAGTFKFIDAIPTLRPSPVSPFWQRLSGVDPNLYWDVDLTFEWFDPPPFGTNYGHNLAPIPNDAQGRWALITTTGTGTDASLYATSDFTKIFTLNGS